MSQSGNVSEKQRKKENNILTSQKGETMIRKGLKRLLGGVMAAAFVGAACFAMPVTAEAAAPWDAQQAPSFYDRFVADSQLSANYANARAQAALRYQQTMLNAQLNAQMNIFDMSLSAERALTGLSLANQFTNYAGNFPAVVNEIATAQEYVTTTANEFIAVQNANIAQYAANQQAAAAYMADALVAQQNFLYAAAVGAQLAAIDRQIAAMDRQVFQAYNDAWVLLGYSQ